jgi:hypothetical protein
LFEVEGDPELGNGEDAPHAASSEDQDDTGNGNEGHGNGACDGIEVDGRNPPTSFDYSNGFQNSGHNAPNSGSIVRRVGSGEVEMRDMSVAVWFIVTSQNFRQLRGRFRKGMCISS